MPAIAKHRVLIRKAHEIDYSRCVTCMDCIGKCKHGAITYTRRKPKNEIATSEDTKAKSVTTEQVDNAPS